MAVRDKDTPAGAAATKAPDVAPAGGTPDAERLADLERENEALRRMLAQAQGMAGTIRLETSETPEQGPRKLVLSEGVRDDLERFGKVTDPGSGYVLERDAESGEVAIIDHATGKPAVGVELAARRG